MKNRVALVLLLALCAESLWIGLAAAKDLQSPKRDIYYYFERALNAHQENDYEGFLENALKVYEFRPNNPSMMYNVACGYSLTGNTTEALHWLSRMADMGLYLDMEAESDFAMVLKRPESVLLKERFEANREPIGNSALAMTLEEKDLLAEGIAYDPSREAFYISSIHKRKIVKVSKSGEVSDFVAEGQDGLCAVFGMKVDPERDLLWACSSPVPEMRGSSAGEFRSAVFKYDLETGSLVKKYMLPDATGEHVFGDLAIDGNGDVYVADSVSKELFRIDSSSHAMEVFLKSDAFSSLQGLTFSEDPNILYLADFGKGIFRLNTETKELSLLSCQVTVNATGVDGLYYYGDSLLAIQNRVNPHRVSRFYLNAAGDRIARWETIEVNHPDFQMPTLGVVVENELYYIANSQWPKFGGNGGAGPKEELDAPIVLKARL